MKKACGLIMANMKFVRRMVLHDEIIKSPQDKRQYRGLELTNGMKVMVISDPDTDKSSAAMDVHIGAMSDPWELQGLAHFCEHMLFLGSKKYENENDYDEFLNEHGGMCNASTGAEHTTYFFDVAPEHLNGALDRLGQFFLCPLFTASATDREVNAVNSENDKNLPIDGRRLRYLDRTLSKPNHDWRKFSCGNKDTLGTVPASKGIDVREALLKFHAQYYSSNIMSLCVLGKESLDELSDMVIPIFGDVENKSVSIPKWLDPPYGPDQLKSVCYAVPIREMRNVTLMWPIPDLQDYYTSKPGNYIAHLIGHEASGSLLSELKAKGWADSLTCGSSWGATGFQILTVEIRVTEEGLGHVDEIVTLTYQYINMLKKDGPKEWIFTEYQSIRAMKFKFKDKEQSRNYTPTVSRSMQNYPMEETLSGGHLMKEFRPDIITMVLDRLVPDNMRIRVTAKKFEDIADQTEKIYGTKYKLEKIPEEKIKVWSTCGFHENFRLPAVNEFIPENFELVTREPEPSSFPQLIKDSDLTRLWFQQDDTFLQPKANIKFSISSPLTYLSPSHYVLTKLFVMLFKDDLNEYAYDAELAGLHYDLTATKYGITLSVSGYNDKQPILLKKIINKLTKFSVDPDKFPIIKEKYGRILKNFKTDQPNSHVTAYRAWLMSEVYWTNDELQYALPDVTMEMVSTFVPQMLSHVYIEGLISGNVTKQSALAVVEMVEEILQSQSGTRPLLLSQRKRFREHQLPDGSYFVHKEQTEIHKSSCTQVYLQCGLQETESNVLLDLISQTLREICFTTLRTREQLGYIVRSGGITSNGTHGYRILVQSSKPPQYVEGRIEAFLSAMDVKLRDMTEEEFKTHVEALTVKRMDKPKSIREQHQHFWSEIRDQDYNFDRDNIEVTFLKTLKKENLYKFFKDHIALDAPKRHKLATHVESTLKSSDEGETTETSKEMADKTPAPILPKPIHVTDVCDFKRDLALYPLPEPYIDICKAKSML